MIYKKYWDLASPNIKLSKLNELLQSNRDNANLVNPLLKVLSLMDVQADESESYGDILNLLKIGLTKYMPSDNDSLLRTMSKSLKRLID